MTRFCDITSRNKLADFLGIPRKVLTYILYVKKVESFYSSFDILKKNGGTRTIKAPSKELKSIQKKLASELERYQQDIWASRNIKPNMSHGFQKKKSIVTNAKIHRNKKYVLNIDLEDFFDSFHFGRVSGFFQKNRDFALPIEVATALAQLTCFEGCLPQGAPTSPIITNLICQILDNRLLKIAKRYRLDYTRYADDLTFSTNDKTFVERKDAFLHAVQKEVENAGFKINENKTRLLYKDSQQKVTGLVVNEKVNVAQEYYRKTKSMAHSLYKSGEFTIDGQAGTLQQLEGRFSFINQLTWYNNKQDGKEHSFGTLSGREREFKRFLFYKWFYGNDIPIIVTEGKTDVRYLKAALKALYKDYPDLITKNKDGKFEFKIMFFKRTKRLRYFLGIQLDGADAMQSIYKYYVGGKGRESKNYPNYFAYFQRMGAQPKKPTILLFDHETKSNHPLGKLLTKPQFTEEQVQKLEKELHLKVFDKGNLYLLTNPLIPGKEECEIEYLFLENTRSTFIDKKRLCLKDKYDTEKYYGKEIFSQYIASHFEQINFDGFRPLLDALNSIVRQ